MEFNDRRGPVWYHTGADPTEHTGYVHLGAHPSVGQQRVGGKRDTYEVHISPRKALNSPDKPLDDWEANNIGLLDATHRELGRMPTAEDLDPDFEDAPNYARDRGWTPDHDAIFYLNDVERHEGKPTISAMVRASAIRKIKRI